MQFAERCLALESLIKTQGCLEEATNNHISATNLLIELRKALNDILPNLNAYDKEQHLKLYEGVSKKYHNMLTLSAESSRTQKFLRFGETRNICVPGNSENDNETDIEPLIPTDLPRETPVDCWRRGERIKISPLLLPTSPNSQISQNLEYCIVEYGITSAILLQNLRHCVIVVEGCQGALYMKNMQHCVIIGKAHQARLHDSQDVILLLTSATSPIIESCRDIQSSAELVDFEWLKSSVPSPNWALLSNSKREDYDRKISHLLESHPYVIDAENLELTRQSTVEYIKTALGI